MIYLIIGLIVGGAIALVAGFLREKKLKRQLKNGEITEDDLKASRLNTMMMRNWTVFEDARVMLIHPMKSRSFVKCSTR